MPYIGDVLVRPSDGGPEITVGEIAASVQSGVLSGKPSTDADFTVVLLPDTQNMTWRFKDVWAAIPAWIAANQGAANIKAVLCVGDVVNDANDSTQLVTGRAGWDVIAATGLPNFIALGNHDYDSMGVGADRACTKFSAAFPLSFVSGKPWFGGSYDGTVASWWGTFEAGSKKFLVLVLEIYTRTEVLAWAQGVLDAHPDRDVIVTTHSYLGLDGKRTRDNDKYGRLEAAGPPPGNDADAVWNTFVKVNPRIFMVLSGHQIISPSSSYFPDVSDGDTIVHQLYFNHQEEANGGNGYIGLLKFRPSLGTIEMTGYSVTLDRIEPTNTYTMPYSNPKVTAGLTTAGPVLTRHQGEFSSLISRGDAYVYGAMNVGLTLEVGLRRANSYPRRAALEVTGGDGAAVNITHLRLNGVFSHVGGSGYHITNNAYWDTGWKHDVTGRGSSKISLDQNGGFIASSAPAGTAGTHLTWLDTMALSGDGTLSLQATDFNHLRLADRFSLIGQSDFSLTNNATWDGSQFVFDGAHAASRIALENDGSFWFQSSDGAGVAGDPVTFANVCKLFAGGNVTKARFGDRFYHLGTADYHITNNAFYDTTYKRIATDAAVMATFGSDGSFSVSTAASGAAFSAITWTVLFTIAADGKITRTVPPEYADDAAAAAGGLAVGAEYRTGSALKVRVA